MRLRPDKDRPSRILIVAGEASGDLHGAALVREIRARVSDCELFGIAGEQMRAAGVRALVNVEEIAGLGVVELASTIGRTLRVMRMLIRLVKHDPPNLVILIDYADFNLFFARFVRRAGVPILYYIVPQVWAWRRGRVAKLVRRSDRLAVVFPFEKQVYSAGGDRVVFVGHPLLDIAQPAADRTTTLARHGFPPVAHLLAILPGSRRGEVLHLLPPMAAAARLLADRRGLLPVILLAPTLTEADLRAAAGDVIVGMRIIAGDSYSIIAASELALVTSGTATLETALLGCPMVIAYKMSLLSYAVARALVRGVGFIGMPNILAGRRIVPELIQRDVTAEKLAHAGEMMLDEPTRSATIAALGTIRSMLGMPGAAGRVADIALGMIA
jgi:lipid-A-disaccharide synthase